MAYSMEQNNSIDNRQARTNVRTWLGIIWYFIIGSETIYHIFKGLYLTWIFSIKIPMEKVLARVAESGPMLETDMVGMTLFSIQEWQYHFVFGLRGPMVLFGAYLLYKYTLYLSPFSKKGGANRDRSRTPGRYASSHSSRDSGSNNHRRGRSSNSSRNRT